jgi:uncharacterized protein with NRDE domain
MCLIVVAWHARADLPLVVAANRDEWRDRPAERARWWPDHPGILAGRDLKAGGTWLGITRDGRFAAITNYRDPAERRSTAPSRGALAIDYLLGDEPPARYLTRLLEVADRYNAFNLIVGDARSLFYFGSKEGTLREIAPGVHGLSNHLLDEPWPKVRRGREAMERALGDADPSVRLFEMLSQSAAAADAELPETGVGLAWERRLSPALITGPEYGTRCSTVVTVAASGEVRFEERTRDAGGAVVDTVVESFASAGLAAHPLL